MINFQTVILEGMPFEIKTPLKITCYTVPIFSTEVHMHTQRGIHARAYTHSIYTDICTYTHMQTYTITHIHITHTYVHAYIYTDTHVSTYSTNTI